MIVFVLSVYCGWYTFLFLGRCQLREKEIEVKELKEQLNELVGLLRQSEARRKEIEKQQKLREQAVAIALATSASVRLSLFAMDYLLSFNRFMLKAKVNCISTLQF